MNPERWQQIERIYNEAVELPEDQRAAFIEAACAGDSSLRKEIERLLARQSQAESFIESPAMEMAAQALARDQKSRIDTDLVGRTLLHYQVTGRIGEGGMGVVYRAQDMHLERPVAIKVLPELFEQDAGRLVRFEREARLLATLSHPNIAAIYGLEKQDGRSFIVLELVEGLTLEERLRKGPIPLDEALDLCCQVAEGLEAAHEKGIIHRDLKPANIKLTSAGKVKILDFGLAKALRDDADSVDLSAQNTASLTASGVILGTAAYMSPEQARGKALDKRTDVWAFGCLLYECLTARKAFEGETLTETVAAILRDEPDWSAIPASTPHNVSDLLHRCLRKDMKRRFRDIGDARIELGEAGAANFDGARSAPDGVRSDRQPTAVSEAKSREPGRGLQPTQTADSRKRHRYVWAVAALSVVIVVVASIYWISRRETREIEPAPIPVPFTTDPGPSFAASFSPDGSQVAFAWNAEKADNADIYVKQIGNEFPRRLTTDPHDDVSPAWSPDGQSIAFLRWHEPGQAAVMLVPANGGRERQVTEVQAPNLGIAAGKSLCWHPGGKWLAVVCDQESEDAPAAIYLISEETREKRKLTSPPRGVRFDSDPAFSPDGRTLAFARYVRSSSELFLLRVSADLTPEGEPKQLTFMDQDTCLPAWTRDGKEIVFASGSKTPAAYLWRVPASGSGKPRTLPFAFERGVNDVAIALNRERLIYGIWSADFDIWRLEIPIPETEPPAPQKFLASTRPLEEVQYSPDGRSVAYGSWASGNKEIWVCDGDGTNPEQLTHLGGPVPYGLCWSPDGQHIVFQLEAQGKSDLYSLPAQGGKASRLTSASSNELNPCYSGDGRWIYFASDRTGESQVWKMPAEGGEAIQITRKGGLVPQESMDGKTLFYTKRRLKIRQPSTGTEYEELWEVPVDGGEERRLLEEVNRRGLAVKQGGVYFASEPDRDGTPLMFHDFRSGKTRIVARIPPERNLSNFTVSPDGRTILSVLRGDWRSNLWLVEHFR